MFAQRISLLQALEQIPDPRFRQGRRYRVDVLLARLRGVKK